MPLLVMIRHGQSAWNKRNRFTGWVDIPLSEEGMKEAIEAGKKIADINFDIIFTSALIRAHQTVVAVMEQNESGKIPVFLHPGQEKMEEWSTVHSESAKAGLIPVLPSWHLNERMYGVLQGCDKDETRAQFGADQVKIWRRSFDVAPPEGESLKMTAERTIPYFEQEIVPRLAEGKNVLIAAHGNSLRSIVMQLDGLTAQQVVEFEIETGVFLVYRYQDGSFKKCTL